MHQDATCYGCRPQTRGLCVRWRPSPPSPKRGRSPHKFLAHYSDQTAGCIKMPLRMEVGLSPEDFVFDGDSDPSPKRGRSPQFSAHVYCGQTAAWIKMPLVTEIGLGPNDIWADIPLPKNGTGPPNFRPIFIVAKQLDASRCFSPGDFVFDEDPATPRKKAHPPDPIFRPCLLCQTAGWMKRPLGTEVDLGPGRFVLHGFPAIRERGTTAPPLFGPCVLWLQSPISATAEFLF